MLYNYIFSGNLGKLLSALPEKKNHTDEYIAWRDGWKEKMLSTPCREFTLENPKGIKLKGFYYQAGDAPSGRIAFIVHGYRSEHAEAAGPFLQLYHSRGIDVFAVDLAAHGESEGELIGWTYPESEDCLLWLELLLMEFGEDIRIILHGFSMGGCIVLSMADRVPENVAFIIDDCGFTSAEDMLRPQLGPLYPVLNALNLKKQGFSLSSSDARPHLKEAKCPVLFCHGLQDPVVPPEMTEELYRCCSSPKDRLLVSGAKHVECLWRAYGQYAAAIDRFVQFYL